MTTSIFSTASARHALPASKVLTVTPLLGATAIVSRKHDFAELESLAITAAQTFGPYPSAMTFDLSCIGGEVRFVQSDATDPLLGVVALAATDASATAMLITADSLTGMVLLQVAKVTIAGVDYYIPLFGAD